MELYNGLPLLYADVDENIEGVSIVSIVERPAVERNFLKLSKEEKVRFSLDDEKRIMTGLALEPDKKIYRRDEKGNEWYVTFTVDAIKRIVEKFFKDYKATNVNLEHEEIVNSCVIYESYLIDKERGICPVEFSDLPNGSWMITMKCNDENLWKDIKDGKYNGFSIEGLLMFDYKPVEQNTEKGISTLEELFDWLEGLG